MVQISKQFKILKPNHLKLDKSQSLTKNYFEWPSLWMIKTKAKAIAKARQNKTIQGSGLQRVAFQIPTLVQQL